MAKKKKAIEKEVQKWLSYILKKNDYRSVIGITFVSDMVFIWWRFRHLIKVIAAVAENILNNDDFFGDIVDTSKNTQRKQYSV